MASILDVGILNYFVPAFVFLMVYGIILALLEKTKMFGDNKAINQIISIGIAMLFILTPDLVGVIKVITPWFTILFIFLVLIMLLFLFVGVSESEVASVFKEKGNVWIIIVIAVGILIFGLTQVYGSQISNIYAGEGANATGDGGLNQIIGQIIFHPRILGMIFLLVVAAQAMRMITSNK